MKERNNGKKEEKGKKESQSKHNFCFTSNW